MLHGRWEFCALSRSVTRMRRYDSCGTKYTVQDWNTSPDKTRQQRRRIRSSDMSNQQQFDHTNTALTRIGFSPLRRQIEVYNFGLIPVNQLTDQLIKWTDSPRTSIIINHASTTSNIIIHSCWFRFNIADKLPRQYSSYRIILCVIFSVDLSSDVSGHTSRRTGIG